MYVLEVLKKGGDNLEIYEAVRTALTAPPASLLRGRDCFDRDVIAQAIYEAGMEPDNDATTWGYAMRISETWKDRGPDFTDQAAMYQRSVDEALAQADAVIAALSASPPTKETL